MSTSSTTDTSSSNTGSTALYLYTFLGTLVLLLAVIAAVVTRSVQVRRRNRRAIEEAIRNGTWVPHSSSRGQDTKPLLHEIFIAPVSAPHDQDQHPHGVTKSLWDRIMPFSVEDISPQPTKTKTKTKNRVFKQPVFVMEADVHAEVEGADDDDGISPSVGNFGTWVPAGVRQSWRRWHVSRRRRRLADEAFIRGLPLATGSNTGTPISSPSAAAAAAADNSSAPMRAVPAPCEEKPSSLIVGVVVAMPFPRHAEKEDGRLPPNLELGLTVVNVYYGSLYETDFQPR
ncbi:hypothetical protein FISHEDRAFT_78145 [Fistulina hepatica ATCC 64428]|nr:hypothetical protein FISHEDRAFT_78145 [Fistulina hepatica ATCC 64428]